MTKSSDKKGLSVMIGYVLLISIAIIISVVVYQWIKTYVPAETLECRSGVSLYVKDYIYDCNANTLSLTIKNSGRFNVAGYFIHGAKNLNDNIATTDLSDYTEYGEGGSVIVPPSGNELNPVKPGNEVPNSPNVFNIPLTEGQMYFVEIIPVRYEEINNKNRIVICSDAKVKEVLSCAVGECGNGVIVSGETCDDGNINSGDGCSSGCQVESGWTCIGEPSICIST